MTMAVWLAIAQAVIILLLAADRWFHRVTGEAPLEARVTTLESAIDLANVRLSKTLSEIQKGIGEIQVLQGRQDEHLKAIDRSIVTLEQWRDRLRGAGV